MTDTRSTIPQTPPLNPLTISALEKPGIRHAFFTREGGVSDGIYRGLNGGLGSRDNQDHIVENRRRMANHFGVDSDCLLSLYQIHSADAVVVEQKWTDTSRPKADAMVTNQSGLVLAISTADCGPILFADPTARVIGAAHSGWKGAVGGVLEATLSGMERLGAKRHQITACLGPMIRQASYEVDAGFRNQFTDHSLAYATFFKEGVRDGKFQFDLPAFIRHRLAEAAVEHIEDLELCTYQDEARFYSYRRTTHRDEADYGRLISAISLVD